MRGGWSECDSECTLKGPMQDRWSVTVQLLLFRYDGCWENMATSCQYKLHDCLMLIEFTYSPS